MSLFLSKLLPLFFYPTGFACLLFFVLMALDLWQRKWNGRSWIALLGFLTLMLGGNFYVAHWISHSLELQYPPLTENPSAEAIVILGGGVNPHLPPRQHPEISEAGDRIFHAAFLYHQGYAPLIVSSGGWVTIYWESGPNRSEAKDSAVLLQALGIPADKILFETESNNTRENAVMTAELLKKEGINRIILVSTARHMPRAVPTFEMVGLEVIPAPTDYYVTGDPDVANSNLFANFRAINLLPTALNLEFTTVSLKEYVGLVYYRLRGWI